MHDELNMTNNEKIHKREMVHDDWIMSMPGIGYSWKMVILFMNVVELESIDIGITWVSIVDETVVWLDLLPS